MNILSSERCLSAQGRIRAILAGLVKTLLGQLFDPLGAYEKAWIDRLLNEVNAGRMTSDEAQQVMSAEWIAAHGPTRRLAAWRGGGRNESHAAATLTAAKRRRRMPAEIRGWFTRFDTADLRDAKVLLKERTD
jgi:hypothetical protein